MVRGIHLRCAATNMSSYHGNWVCVDFEIVPPPPQFIDGPCMGALGILIISRAI